VVVSSLRRDRARELRRHLRARPSSSPLLLLLRAPTPHSTPTILRYLHLLPIESRAPSISRRAAELARAESNTRKREKDHKHNRPREMLLSSSSARAAPLAQAGPRHHRRLIAANTTPSSTTGVGGRVGTTARRSPLRPLRAPPTLPTTTPSAAIVDAPTTTTTTTCTQDHDHAHPQAQPSQPPAVDWYKQWYPVAAVSDLFDDRPNAVRLLDKELVAWKDGQGIWRVAADFCPHRLSPLSEGRVEVRDGGVKTLACPCELFFWFCGLFFGSFSGGGALCRERALTPLWTSFPPPPPPPPSPSHTQTTAGNSTAPDPACASRS
jgi:hypothetical protein